MWTYYGTKKKLAKYYPAPRTDMIVEPFAGAAQYSLYGNNWEKDVVLIDKYPTVISIWRYLQNASKEDILSLPDMNLGDNVDNFNQLSQDEKWLIGFCINSASAMPKKTVQKRSQWNSAKKTIADNLYKIKHWQIMCGDYKSFPNLNATWFIDPPYQFGGIYYRYSNVGIDYKELSDWCLSRKGDIIVCENSKADWLPFTPLAKLNGQLHTTMESIFYRKGNNNA